MKAFITGVCVLWAFITTGHSLECEDCFSLNSLNCTGPSRTCVDNETHCEAVLAESTFVGEAPAYKIYKNCSKLQFVPYHEKTNTFEYRLQPHVCTGDNCNNGTFQLTEKDDTPNGIKCPECYVEGAYDCDTNGSFVSCTGDMKNCLHYGGDVRWTGDVVTVSGYRGCTNIKVESCSPFPLFPGGIVDRQVFGECLPGQGAKGEGHHGPGRHGGRPHEGRPEFGHGVGQHGSGRDRGSARGGRREYRRDPARPAPGRH